MPSVNLSPETYEKLKELAARKGRSPDEVAQDALQQHVLDAVTAWADQLAEVDATPTESLTEEQTDFLVDYEVKAVRTEDRARRLSHQDRLTEWRKALAEVRRSIPTDISLEALTQEIDGAIEEVRAERRARSR